MPCGKDDTTLYKRRIRKTDRKMSKGYPIAVLVAGAQKKRTATVHRLVAEAFVPNPDNLPFIRHRDDNPLNASASNLLWGTPQDNARDKRCPHCKKLLFSEGKK